MAAEQNAIHVEQDVNPGELVDDRSIVVAVTSRRKLGKQLTIARCVVDDVRGELHGGLARNEIIDVVAGGASAKHGANAKPPSFSSSAATLTSQKLA